MNETPGSLVELITKTPIHARKIHWNLTPPLLYEEVIQRREAMMAEHGPLVVYTGKCTGRSPNDKFFVQEPSSQDQVWWGKTAQPFPPEKFEKLKSRVIEYFKQKDLFIQDCYGGADPTYRFPARIITDTAWGSLFAYNMFIHAGHASPQEFVPEFTVMVASGFEAEPEIDGTRSDVVIAIHLGQKLGCDSRDALCRRNQENRFYRPELSFSTKRCFPHALFRQHRTGGRYRFILRA